MMLAEDLSTSLTLLEAVANPVNDEAAWARFMMRYRPLIERWGHRCGLNHTDAEDVSGTVFRKLVTALRGRQYDGRHRFRPWLKTIVQHAVGDHFRSKSRRPGDYAHGDAAIRQRLDEVEARLDPESLSVELDAAISSAHAVALRVVERVRERLRRPSTWDAFRLAVLEGRSHEEVAALLGMKSAHAVDQAICRVRYMLREERACLLRAEPGIEGE